MAESANNKVNEIKEDALLLSKSNARISEANRMSNTLVLGKKKTGKSNNILTSFAKQDFEKKDCGLTFVVSRKDMAYTLYEIARDAGRKAKDIVMLKPSASFRIANEFVWQKKYSYNQVADFIDYKDAIKKKKVIIIDMEYSHYRDLAISATAMLLMQLQVDMQDVQATLKRKHFVYIDDAYSYMPFIELLLTTGNEYNVGTMLFMQSREELNINSSEKENYTCLLDNNIRNLILTSGLNTSDAEFYRKQLISSKLLPYDDSRLDQKLHLYANANPNLVEVKEGKAGYVIYSCYSMNTMVCRKPGNIIYETIDSNGQKVSGTCQLLSVTEEYMKRIQKRAIKTRKKMTNEFMRQVPNLSNLEREGFSTLQPKEDSYKNPTQTGQNSVINQVEEEVIASTENVELLDLLGKSDEELNEMANNELSEINEAIHKSTKPSKKATVTNTEEKAKTEDKKSVTKPDDKKESGTGGIKALPKFSYKPLADSPKRNEEEVEVKIEPTALEGDLSNIDVDELLEGLPNMEAEISSDAGLEDTISEEPAMHDIENDMSDLFGGEPNIDSDIDKMLSEVDELEDMNTGSQSADVVGLDDISSIDNIDDILDSDLGDIDVDMDMDFTDIDSMDIDEIGLSDDSDTGGLLQNIDAQIENEMRKSQSTKRPTVELEDDEDDSEVFVLGQYKPTNVDRTGIISGCRPKRKMLVFPEITKDRNEVYLNEKFKKS